MPITKKQVLNILNYLDKNKEFYFPFRIICHDFNKDNEFYNFDCLEIEYEVIEGNVLLQNFVLEENLQNLYPETVELMAQGFLDKIEHKDVADKISNLAVEYRKNWKENLCESEDIEIYGLNEFIGGKAEAYKDCLQIIEEHYIKN